ncbi:glycosyltransferase family protein [Reichenbachiella versicolor]|uniref:hypothetical protein n=1 Tax=Reichenbachiella versicolor TaxID=1821036 RepID=UPI000D6E0F59|nr:hypothetical protein [Reichenbachiella versicolor]
MNPKRIAIISILKPVDDIRSYEKFTKTLAQTGDYLIDLIGYPSQTVHEDADHIRFHSLSAFNPKSKERFKQRKVIWNKLKEIKPDLIICTTHELLATSIKAKFRLGCKIIYDIQENYFYNLWYQNNYSTLVKTGLAIAVRLKETVLCGYFDHFFLAEKSYARELLFTSKRSTILENKALNHLLVEEKSLHSRPTFVFTGTLTESNGILRCLKFMKQIKASAPNYRFRIAGHCPDKSIWNELESEQYSFIEKDISIDPIPYDKILEVIHSADFGFIAYRLNPSNQYCMPTKVFEYVAAKVSCIYESGAMWSQSLEKHRLGIKIDYDHFEIDDFLNTQTDYQINEDFDRSHVVWDTESTEMIKSVRRILIS